MGWGIREVGGADNNTVNDIEGANVKFRVCKSKFYTVFGKQWKSYIFIFIMGPVLIKIKINLTFQK